MDVQRVKVHPVPNRQNEWKEEGYNGRRSAEMFIEECEKKKRGKWKKRKNEKKYWTKCKKNENEMARSKEEKIKGILRRSECRILNEMNEGFEKCKMKKEKKKFW